MSVLGIVVEYNPFHNGHLHHLKQAKQVTGASHTIAVMSGNFTQRGLPALLDKYKRTHIALKNGVDMVVELPVMYATSSANYFARGALAILNALQVDHLCFGAETTDLTLLRQASQESSQLNRHLKKGLNQGLSYPAAYQQALTSTGIPLTLSPNNILGIEYLRAIDEIGATIQPHAIVRDQGLQSATAINKHVMRASKQLVSGKPMWSKRRELLRNMPEDTSRILERQTKTGKQISLNDFSQLLHYKLLSVPDTLSQFLDVDEGLENRLINAAQKHYLIDDMVVAMQTKRYSKLKLQRMIAHVLLGITKEQLYNYPTPPYVRVLGFRQGAQALLKDITGLPLITNIKNAHLILGRDYHMLAQEMYATDLYNLVSRGAVHPSREKGIEHRIPLVII